MGGTYLNVVEVVREGLRHAARNDPVHVELAVRRDDDGLHEEGR